MPNGIPLHAVVLATLVDAAIAILVVLEFGWLAGFVAYVALSTVSHKLLRYFYPPASKTAPKTAPKTG